MWPRMTPVEQNGWDDVILRDLLSPPTVPRGGSHSPNRNVELLATIPRFPTQLGIPNKLPSIINLWNNLLFINAYLINRLSIQFNYIP